MTDNFDTDTPTVFISHYDERFNYTPAEKFGRLRAVFSTGMVDRNFNPRAAISAARDVLKSYKDTDYLVLSGDPALSAICVALCAEVNGGCVALRWDKRNFEYTTMPLYFE